MNRLRALHQAGQSFWYDNIRRRYLLDGTVEALIQDDGLRGMTSNPSIFERAIGAGDDYDRQIEALSRRGLGAEEIYVELAIDDIRQACDLFCEVYEGSGGTDGFVSLEVSPLLAHDLDGTVEEARRLFKRVGRPNVMIKVPATEEGVPAVRQLLSEGINVNITLMFSMEHYEKVAAAYLGGLADRLGRGQEASGLGSVASFFVSRVDTAVDAILANLPSEQGAALLGKAAVANSRLVYRRFQEIFHGPSFADLRAAGANVQRLLWASTSTKNPAYPDTLYVDQLIGPETVNTMPPETIDAFRRHGRVQRAVDSGLEDARDTFERLAALDIDMVQVTKQLQREGVAAFARSYQTLLSTLAAKIEVLRGARLSR